MGPGEIPDLLLPEVNKLADPMAFDALVSDPHLVLCPVFRMGHLGVSKSLVKLNKPVQSLGTPDSIPFCILLFSLPGIRIFSTEIIQREITCLILF